MNRKQAKIEALILIVATLQQAQGAGLAAMSASDDVRDCQKVEEEIDGIVDQLQSRLERLREKEAV